MSLDSIQNMVSHAQHHSYAIGYFESWNLESLQGVIDAAEQTRSPIIIGFNGEFLSGPNRLAKEQLEWYAALGQAAAASASVSCGFIFNECPYDDWVCRASELGFNLVMLADSQSPYEDYVQRVAAITRHAHQHGAAVEAEIGELPCGSSGEIKNNGQATDPKQAGHFVKTTGIDLLAVSVGNVHIMVEGEQSLDLDQLGALQQSVSIPMVLHGGSGICSESLKQAIAMGVVKVNYGTYVKQRYLTAVQKALASDKVNPHELLGIGGDTDVLVAGRHAVRDAVLERIDLLGCCGKADR